MDVYTPEPGVIIFDSQVNPRVLAEFGKEVAVVGCRDFSEADAMRARKAGVQLYPMRVLIEDLLSACDGLMEIALQWRSVQLVIFARVLDPAFVKTEHPSHGGLQTRELLYFIARLKLLRNYSGARGECPEGSRKDELEKALRK